jgi:hypothetical protein
MRHSATQPVRSKCRLQSTNPQKLGSLSPPLPPSPPVKAVGISPMINHFKSSTQFFPGAFIHSKNTSEPRFSTLSLHCHLQESKDSKGQRPSSADGIWFLVIHPTFEGSHGFSQEIRGGSGKFSLNQSSDLWGSHVLTMARYELWCLGSWRQKHLQAAAIPFQHMSWSQPGPHCGTGQTHQAEKS